MLIRILSFVLETIFFVLIGAAMLRGWMNWTRINMRAQPGIFVMAVTDWLVKPLRRILPKALGQSRVDWSSVFAAVLFSFAYALVWGLFFGVWSGTPFNAGNFGFDAATTAVLGVLIFAIKMCIRVALQTLMILVIGFAILSWIQPQSPAFALLGRLTDPLLTPLRRVIPSIGGVDMSALVLILILQIGLIVFG